MFKDFSYLSKTISGHTETFSDSSRFLEDYVSLVSQSRIEYSEKVASKSPQLFLKQA